MCLEDAINTRRLITIVVKIQHIWKKCYLRLSDTLPEPVDCRPVELVCEKNP
jgi:hypothetical protein